MRSEQVLIKDQDAGGSTDAIAGAFSSLGLGASNTNVYNELISVQSPALMAQVIQRLDLCNNYIRREFPHGTTLYRSTLPFKVEFPDLGYDNTASFRITRRPDGSATLSKFRLSTSSGVEKFSEEIDLKPGYSTVRTPVGRLVFKANPEYAGGPLEEEESVFVLHRPLQSTVEHYTRQISADLADKDAEIINISIKDDNVQRAEDILRTIIEVYNQDWVNDKNRMAVATSEFIDERLRLIQQELGTVDDDIMSYKSKTMVPDLEEAAKINMQTTRELNTTLLESNNQLSMARYLRDYVNNPANLHSVIPVNTGIGNPTLESQIANYNSMLLMRNNMVESSSASNPLVKDYDAQLTGLRKAIVEGINNQVVTMATAVRNLEGAKGSLQSDLKQGPQQAKYLLSVERQQKVKEALYLYLLQKREENELSQTFTANNTRIIAPPYGPLRPVDPKKSLIMGVAFLVSILLPGALIYLTESTNTKVRSRKDLEHISTPFAGEIPYAGKKIRFSALKKLFNRGKGRHKELETVPVKVQAGNRDIINESFRIVRSNIDMMMRKGGTSNVLMVTSFNPGSGKSFVTYNLAAAFAVKNKRVLVIDCDLRHGSASQYVGMPSHGLSTYLNGHTDDWQSLIVKVEETPGMEVLPIGNRPPNPAELLENGRMETLLNEAKDKYDYIMLDCPPLDVVVDTQILEKYVDHTLFVIRAGLLDRSAIAEIDAMYKNHRFRRMCILLNGTEASHSRYGTYGSSYYGNGFE